MADPSTRAPGIINAPHLEKPEIWPDVYRHLIVTISDNLAPSPHPNDYTAIKKRIYRNKPVSKKIPRKPRNS
ncbi:MAG: DUF4058 family protein [Leptolyngbyaceae cyanobacterium MAG.088]|nr:DUF4058 family protein [Leptolyngbyaceae cyanobacterium MAG.088]